MKRLDKIYLQVEDESGNKLVVGRDEVTWCRDRIYDSDIEYVRADLVESKDD